MMAEPIRGIYLGNVIRRIAPFFVFLAFVSLGAVLWFQKDVLLDWAYTRNYTPSSEIVQLAEQTAMTPYATRLFYVNRPAIEDKEAFNAHCSHVPHNEIAVLGCYRGNRQGIYMYRVTDTRLAGIEEVTAAHEMLHQAYDRLESKERENIVLQLNAYAATIPAGPLKEKLDAYHSLDTADLANEMHSIFGTEVVDLPPQLAEYYKRYFTDRGKVLALYAQYRAAFDERIKQIAAYDAELAVLKEQIEIKRTLLDTSERRLEAERRRMTALLDAERIAEYNAAVPVFNAQIETYKRDVEATNNLVGRYNGIIDARNKIAVEEEELIKAQDSHADSAGIQENQ